MACILALAAVGCGGSSSGGGGGGGGGGGDGVELSAEEQAVLAARSVGGVTGFATDVARDVVEPPEGLDDGAEGADPVASSRTAPLTMTNGGGLESIGLECTDEGVYLFTDDGESLDIADEAFPALFSGSVSNVEGVASNIVVRADCVDVDDDGDTVFMAVGSSDIIELDAVQGGSGRAFAYRAGGFTGPGLDDAPDLAVPFLTESSFGEISIRGEMYLCDGCLDGNLGDFSGVPEFDSTLSAFFDMDMALKGEDSLGVFLGNSLTDRFELVSRDIGGGVAEVDLTGRLTIIGTDDGCDFDVTYATIEPLRVTNFAADGDDITGGRLDITTNDSGATFRVEFDAEGNVFVFDGQGNAVTVDEASLEDECGDELDEVEEELDQDGGGGDGAETGDDSAPGDETDGDDGADQNDDEVSERLAALDGTWRSAACQPLTESPDGGAQQQQFVFDVDSGMLTYTLFRHEEGFCQDEPETFTGQWAFALGDEIPVADDEPQTHELDLTNGSGFGDFPIAVPDTAFEAVAVMEFSDTQTLFFGSITDPATSAAERPQTVDRDMAFFLFGS